MIFPDNVISLMDDTVALAEANNVIVSLVDEPFVKYLDEATGVSGYFAQTTDGVEPSTLMVAIGKPFEDWLPIYLHESSHMDQCIENVPAWTNITMTDGREATDAVFSWIDGEELSDEYLDEAIRRALEVELDCERRTHEKIMKYNLMDIINPEEYVKKSNSYIYFYLFVKSTRSFYTQGFQPYNIEAVWSVAPDTFDNDYLVIPTDLHKAFTKYLKF